MYVFPVCDETRAKWDKLSAHYRNAGHDIVTRDNLGCRSLTAPTSTNSPVQLAILGLDLYEYFINQRHQILNLSGKIISEN